MEGPPLGPGGEDITWPDQVAPRGRKASSTRKIKPQTSNPLGEFQDERNNYVAVDKGYPWFCTGHCAALVVIVECCGVRLRKAKARLVFLYTTQVYAALLDQV